MAVEALRNNLIGLFLSKTEEQEFLKLGHVLALAGMAGIEISDLQKRYAELRRKRVLSDARLRGGPAWRADSASESYKLLVEVLERINRVKPDILAKAAEDAAKQEVSVADLVKRLQGGGGTE